MMMTLNYWHHMRHFTTLPLYHRHSSNTKASAHNIILLDSSTSPTVSHRRAPVASGGEVPCHPATLLQYCCPVAPLRPELEADDFCTALASVWQQSAERALREQNTNVSLTRDKSSTSSRETQSRSDCVADRTWTVRDCGGASAEGEVPWSFAGHRWVAGVWSRSFCYYRYSAQ